MPLKREKLERRRSISPSRPPRYTEASLIKALEENGIGRPSTYAPTITTIIDRDYVERRAEKAGAHRAGPTSSTS